MARIVLFGATGYTGRLVARRLVEQQAPVVLAGRRESALVELADELGGTAHLVVDAGAAEAVLPGALEPGDVLVTTVGPYVRLGGPALRAAVAAGAHYVDVTGEAPFVRRVWKEAAGARGTVLPACGYDFLPGNLAGALALREAGPAATTVEVGYFTTGERSRMPASSGTVASVASLVGEPSHTYADGSIRAERPAARVGTWEVDGRTRRGVSIGGSEQLALPRSFPQLQRVDVHLGWFGPLARVLQVLSGPAAGLAVLPGVGTVLRTGARLLGSRTGAGPDEAARQQVGSLVAARARDAEGRVLARVELEGPNPYDLTAGLVAWVAQRMCSGGARVSGPTGPVAAFGLDEVASGAASVGLRRR